ncbi:MAG: hypothetical protein R3E03_00645 [Novosphingobium sp.]
MALCTGDESAVMKQASSTPSASGVDSERVNRATTLVPSALAVMPERSTLKLSSATPLTG